MEVFEGETTLIVCDSLCLRECPFDGDDPGGTRWNDEPLRGVCDDSRLLSQHKPAECSSDHWCVCVVF